MTESVKVRSEGRFTIGLIDEDRIKYIKAMNTERDTYNLGYARETLTILSTIFSTLLTYVSFGFAAIIYCMSIYYMLIWS